MLKLMLLGWITCGVILLGIVISIYREAVKVERNSDWFHE